MPPARLGIAPLTGGVSTQPPANRFESQTETSDNTLVSVNRGLEKRYGSTMVVSPDLESGCIDFIGEARTAKGHKVERDDDNIYFFAIDKTANDTDLVQVFDNTGTKLTVTIKSGDAALKEYIRFGPSTSRDSIVLKTYGDTTWILNQDVTTALTGEAASYTYNATGVVTTLTTPPTGGLNEYRHLIQPDVGYPTGHYKCIAINTSDTGPWWERDVTPFANSYIDETTMPIQAVYDPTTRSIELSFPEWNPRYSGDPETSPGPSFIGKKLLDIALFQDRLWLSAGQQVVSSQAGDLYNFWPDDWTTITDSDPIDLTLASRSASAGQFLIPFTKTMVIISDGAQQWEIQTLDSFTPSATNVVETTTFEVNKKVTPVTIGNQIYFTTDQGEYSFVWEYFPNYDRDANVGDNISSHVEEYLPRNPAAMAASENNNMLFLSSADEPNVLYVYTTHWRVSEKLQSSWTRWVFDEDADIAGFFCVSNTLYLFLAKNDCVWLETIPLTPPEDSTAGDVIDTDTYAILTEDGEELLTEAGVVLVVDQARTTGIGYHAEMDKTVSSTGVYSSATKTTTFTLPFLDEAMDTVILADAWGDRRGQVISSTTGEAGGVTTLTVTGDYSAYPVLIGKSYAMSVQLTRPVLKDDNNIVLMGNTQIRTMDVLFKDTTTFTVEVTPRGRPTKTRKFNAARYGSAIFGQPSTEPFGRFQTSIRGDASDTTIVIKNDTPFPSLITNLEYQLNFVPARNNPTKR